LGSRIYLARYWWVLVKKFCEQEKPGGWRRSADGTKIGYLTSRPRRYKPIRVVRI
jgi:hypothetical protein